MDYTTGVTERQDRGNREVREKQQKSNRRATERQLKIKRKTRERQQRGNRGATREKCTSKKDSILFGQFCTNFEPTVTNETKSILIFGEKKEARNSPRITLFVSNQPQPEVNLKCLTESYT